MLPPASVPRPSGEHSRDNRGLAAAAAAGGTSKVIGIVGPSVDQIVGFDRARRQFRHVGLAKDDSARGP